MPYSGGSGIITTITSNSAAFTSFIGRADFYGTVVAPYRQAYADLLNGLTTDGLFNPDGTTNFFDILYIDAAPNQNTALQNLPNATYTGTNPASLTFTAGQGFSGAGLSNMALLTGFNPSTAGSPKYVQDSAHLSAWSLTSAQEGNGQLFGREGTTGENLFNRFTDDNCYTRVNDNPEAGGLANTNGLGHYLGNRDSATGRQSYKNGASLGSLGSVASQAVVNAALVALGDSTHPNLQQVAMVSAGASMNATQAANFYTRLRTYMTAVGIP